MEALKLLYEGLKFRVTVLAESVGNYAFLVHLHGHRHFVQADLHRRGCW